MLLDCEPADRSPFPTLAILKVGARTPAAEELVFDQEGEIAGPSCDPEKVPVGHHGAVDQHHHRRAVAIILNQPASQIEQHDGEILVDDAPGAEPVDEKRAGLVAP